MTKQMVTAYADVEIKYTKLPDIIKNLQEALIKYGPDSEVAISEEYGSYTTQIQYRRLETDKEEKRRNEHATSQAAYRKAQYEALKKEFEK